MYLPVILFTFVFCSVSYYSPVSLLTLSLHPSLSLSPLSSLFSLSPLLPLQLSLFLILYPTAVFSLSFLSFSVSVFLCLSLSVSHLSQIRKYLDRKTAETIIHGLVHSHLDYCNALLAGLPKVLIHKLQMVQNSAARVLCRIPSHEHISPVLKEFHWLPISFRIKFKICSITFRVLRGHGPSYLSSMLKVKHSQYSLRSSDSLLLDVPKTKCKTLGDRAFLAAAPTEWNALPKKSTNNQGFSSCLQKTAEDTSIFQSICQPKLTL